MKSASRALWIACWIIVALLPLVSQAQETRRGGSAFFKSLIVPGWGQLELGRKSAALTFFGTEVALVGGMLAMSSYGRAGRADYRSLAAAYAGVVGNHDHDFYVDVGNWMSVDEYNERRLRDRQFDALYTSPEDRWYWDSEDHRGQMERARVRSDGAFNKIFYLIGGLAINHVASAIHAGRAQSKQQKHASILSPQGWSVGLHPAIRNRGLRVSLTHSF
jgi:hypothetical protein